MMGAEYPVVSDQSAQGYRSQGAVIRLVAEGDEVLTPVSVGKQDARFEMTSPLDAGHTEGKAVKATCCLS
jgi:hypothetical protein